ncbi:MAG: biotin/lipoyl-containing protein [Longimicrobiales bacterium]
MKYFVTLQDRTFEVVVGPDGTSVDGHAVVADLARVDGTDVHHLLLDGRSHRVLSRGRGQGIWDLHVAGASIRAEAVDERTHAIRQLTDYHAGPSGPKPVKAPMPGLVVAVEVSPGDTVSAGQGVVIVEAMKMENELKAQADAVVAAVHVAPGDTVEKDQVLIDFETPPAADSED